MPFFPIRVIRVIRGKFSEKTEALLMPTYREQDHEQEQEKAYLISVVTKKMPADLRLH